MDRFWTDFGPILDRFLVDFEVVFAVDVDVVADVVVNDVTMYYALTLTLTLTLALALTLTLTLMSISIIITINVLGYNDSYNAWPTALEIYFHLGPAAVGVALKLKVCQNLRFAKIDGKPKNYV